MIKTALAAAFAAAALAAAAPASADIQDEYIALLEEQVTVHDPDRAMQLGTALCSDLGQEGVTLQAEADALYPYVEGDGLSPEQALHIVTVTQEVLCPWTRENSQVAR